MLAYRSLLSKSLERDTNPSYRRRRSSVCAAFFNQIGGNKTWMKHVFVVEKLLWLFLGKAKVGGNAIRCIISV